MTVTDNAEASRWEVHVDGALAGLADYAVRNDTVLLTHTEVMIETQGVGLAGRLAEAAFADARTRGRSVAPLCSYMAAWVDRHPEYADLVAHR